MPRLSGIELAAMLHARENGQTPPILLMSANRPRQLPDRIFFLPKPFDLPDLLRSVAALLRDMPPSR